MVLAQSGQPSREIGREEDTRLFGMQLIGLKISRIPVGLSPRSLDVRVLPPIEACVWLFRLFFLLRSGGECACLPPVFQVFKW